MLRFLNNLRFRNIVCAVVASAIFLLSSGNAQETSQTVVARTSNLSSALPPGEWARVETSVDKALEWLASQQAEDGRFPSMEAAQPAVTSMAIMAFLSRGHIPGQGPYGKQLTHAIDFVLSTQRRRGYFSLLPVTPPAQHMSPSQTVTYNHSIAGLMLGEVYGMTSGEQSKRIESAIRDALVYHREVQVRVKKTKGDIGGWRYWSAPIFCTTAYESSGWVRG